MIRCEWAETDDGSMQAYHDREWGVPVHDDRKHFEFLVLETAQAGLSWSTILHKRAGYARAFAKFDPVRVARFDEQRIDRLLQDPGIVRNRKKVEAAVGNASLFLRIQEEFGSFDRYCWGFVGGGPRQNRRRSMREIPVSTPESDEFSHDLRARGFRFVGSTILYAHMQAVGMVNDHLTRCFRYNVIRRLGSRRDGSAAASERRGRRMSPSGRTDRAGTSSTGFELTRRDERAVAKG